MRTTGLAPSAAIPFSITEQPVCVRNAAKTDRTDCHQSKLCCNLPRLSKSKTIIIFIFLMGTANYLLFLFLVEEKAISLCSLATMLSLCIEPSL